MARRMDPRVKVLAEMPLFAGCSAKQLQAISGLLDETNVSAGRVLMREGRPGRECFIIVHGCVRVTTGSRELAELGPGEVVGEMALVDRTPRSATVTATEPTTLYVLDPLHFTDLLTSHPIVARKIMATLVARIRQVGAAAVAS